MLHPIASLLAHRTAKVSTRTTRDQEWSRLLAQATSQNERDEINDLFSGAIAV